MASICMDETGPWDDAKGWSPVGGVINQHFHGFLVPPTAGKPGDPAKPFGDYIFTCAYGTGGQAERQYSMDLSDAKVSLPDGTIGHPAGIDWFHPHVHGVAKPEVASGMAGMILVGDPQCSDPTACADVRPILLKDAQLVEVPNGSGGTHWLNFADQAPDFCGGPDRQPDNRRLATNVGDCPFSASTSLDSGGTSLTPSSGKWVFTLNGAEYPTIVASGPQVWRVQNASANITYRLSLRQLSADPAKGVADAPFEVISLDGAGLAGTAGSGAFAPQTREILLMPGSRADLRVSRPVDGGDGELAYQLVNEAFQAGFSPNDADTWPHVALAKVVFPEAQTASASPVSGANATLAMVRRARSAPAARLRLPVQENAVAKVRGTALTRDIPQIPSDTAALTAMPPDETTANAAAHDMAGMPGMAAGETVVSPPQNRAAARELRSNGSNSLFAMARWLREDCDGYSSTDSMALVDSLLQQAMPGHQPIASDIERKFRYWTSLHFDPRTTHRRIYFGIQDAEGDERFVLGETLVKTVPFGGPNIPRLQETDLYGRSISPKNPVVLTTFDPVKGLCVLKRNLNSSNPQANVEQWELVNVSKEVHNFHIHQMKFTVARDANGQSIMRTPSALDLVQLPASLLLASDGSVPAELQHDTIIVPRGVTQCETSLLPLGSVPGAHHPVFAFVLDRSVSNANCTGLDHDQMSSSNSASVHPDGSGMILVNMSFEGDWLAAKRDGDNVLQPARFVFHCHILEHEDKGMMHRIAVLDPNVH